MQIKGNIDLLKQHRIATLMTNLEIDQDTAEQLREGKAVDLGDTPMRQKMLEIGIISTVETVDTDVAADQNEE